MQQGPYAFPCTYFLVPALPQTEVLGEGEQGSELSKVLQLGLSTCARFPSLLVYR